MSYVTDVLVSCPMSECDQARDISFVDGALNDWLRDQCNASLRQVSRYAGGRHKSTNIIYMGVFNYLPIDEFIAKVNGLPWRDMAGVMVFLKSAHATEYTLVRYHRKKLGSYQFTPSPIELPEVAK